MPSDPVFQELQLQLDAADWLGDDERADMADLLERFRVAFDEATAKHGVPPENLEDMRERVRGPWLDLLEENRKVAVAEDDLLVKTADLADTSRDLAIELLRISHAMKQAMDEGNFQGTWDELQAAKAAYAQVNDDQDALLHCLTAEDIQQLESEGVL